MLLDKFLGGMSPRDIEAATMPTLEELQAEMDEQGAQWVKEALASDPGKYHLILFLKCVKSQHMP